MNRFHVHLNVTDLASSVRFYTALFSVEPTVRKNDYAKWMLDDPRVNFAISQIGGTPGVDHLGIQAESSDELAALGQRLDAAGGTITPEAGAVCCYAQSDKLWTEDPQGMRWETFHTVGEATSYYANQAATCGTEGASCAPATKPAQTAPTSARACCAPGTACG